MKAPGVLRIHGIKAIGSSLDGVIDVNSSESIFVDNEAKYVHDNGVSDSICLHETIATALFCRYDEINFFFLAKFPISGLEFGFSLLRYSTKKLA